jgi:predicted outer membrane repeat protein
VGSFGHAARSAIGSVRISVAALALNAPLSAMAAGTVTQCANDAQLSSKLAGGGTVGFNCGTQTITLGSPKTIAANTILDGGGHITLNANHSMRLFVVNAGATLTLRNIVLTGGYSAGDGGAIYSSGTLTLDHARITDSEAHTGSGGAIFTSQGKVTIDHSTLDHNSGFNGGAIMAFHPGANVIVTNSTLDHNSAFGGGPNNGLGGAVLLWDGGTVKATKSDFHHNTAYEGGAIDDEFPNSTIKLTDTQLRANVAPNGGGIYLYQGTATLTRAVLSGNGGSGGSGGGLATFDGTVTITASNIVGNHADSGGGVFQFAGLLTLRNTTISGNHATQGGGGILFSAGESHLFNVTIAENGDTSSHGGNIDVSDGEVHLTNVLNAASSAGGNCYGNLPIVSHSLSSDASCHWGSPYDNAHVRLGPLDTNGGPLPTYRLLPSSAAIIEGTNTDCPSTDERGVHRPSQGTCDVGAFEYTPCGGKPPASSAFVPANGGSAHAGQVRLDWVGADCTTQFGITVRRGSRTGAVAFSSNSLPGSTATTTSLPAGTYYWQSKACNWSGCTAGPWLKLRLTA